MWPFGFFAIFVAPLGKCLVFNRSARKDIAGNDEWPPLAPWSVLTDQDNDVLGTNTQPGESGG